MMAIINKLLINGDKKEDVGVVEKIIRYLTPKYNFIVCLIEKSKNIDELSIEELENSLKVHERKVFRKDEEEQVLQAFSGNYQRGGGNGNKARAN